MRGSGAALALCAAAALTACAAPVASSGSAAACAIEKVVELPLESDGRLKIVAASLDGKPVRLVVDTGSSGTVLFDEVSARMDLPTDWAMVYQSTGVSGVSTRHGLRVREMRLGTLVLHDRPLVVAPISNGIHFDGLLGMDVLHEFDMDFDAARNVATLYRPRDCPEGQPAWISRSTRCGLSTRVRPAAACGCRFG